MDSGSAHGRSEVVALDTTAYTFTLVNTLEAEPEALKAAVLAFFEEVGVPNLDEMRAEMESATLTMRDVNRYVVDYDGGWVLSLDRSRVVVSQGSRQEQFMTIRTLDPEGAKP